MKELTPEQQECRTGQPDNSSRSRIWIGEFDEPEPWISKCANGSPHSDFQPIRLYRRPVQVGAVRPLCLVDAGRHHDQLILRPLQKERPGSSPTAPGKPFLHRGFLAFSPENRRSAPAFQCRPCLRSRRSMSSPILKRPAAILGVHCCLLLVWPRGTRVVGMPKALHDGAKIISLGGRERLAAAAANRLLTGAVHTADTGRHHKTRSTDGNPKRSTRRDSPALATKAEAQDDLVSSFPAARRTALHGCAAA